MSYDEFFSIGTTFISFIITSATNIFNWLIATPITGTFIFIGIVSAIIGLIALLINAKRKGGED